MKWVAKLMAKTKKKSASKTSANKVAKKVTAKVAKKAAKKAAKKTAQKSEKLGAAKGGTAKAASSKKLAKKGATKSPQAKKAAVKKTSSKKSSDKKTTSKLAGDKKSSIKTGKSETTAKTGATAKKAASTTGPKTKVTAKKLKSVDRESTKKTKVTSVDAHASLTKKAKATKEKAADLGTKQSQMKSIEPDFGTAKGLKEKGPSSSKESGMPAGKKVQKGKKDEDDLFLNDDFESDGFDEEIIELDLIEEAEETSSPEEVEVILTDAEGRRYCRVRDCDQLSMVDGYCRYHYLLFWKKIQVRKKILTEGKLERYIEELTSRYPDKFLDMLRKDLRSEKEFLAAIQELEIDEASDNDFEEDDQSFIEEVRGMSDGGGTSSSRDDDDY